MRQKKLSERESAAQIKNKYRFETIKKIKKKNGLKIYKIKHLLKDKHHTYTGMCSFRKAVAWSFLCWMCEWARAINELEMLNGSSDLIWLFGFWSFCASAFFLSLSRSFSFMSLCVLSMCLIVDVWCEYAFFQDNCSDRIFKTFRSICEQRKKSHFFCCLYIELLMIKCLTKM